LVARSWSSGQSAGPVFGRLRSTGSDALIFMLAISPMLVSAISMRCKPAT
jgi:hypothetical protein